MKACRSRLMPLMMALTTGAAFGALFSPASPSAPRVAGRMTYKGKPVTEGAVIFMPSDRTKACWGAGASSKTALS